MEPGASPAHLPTTAVVAPLRVGTLALAWISPMPDSSHLRAVLHAFAQIFGSSRTLGEERVDSQGSR